MAKRKLTRLLFVKNRKWRLALEILTGCFLFFLLLGSIAFLYFAKELPRPESFNESSYILPTTIYASDGTTVLYQIYGEERRTVVPLSEISPTLQHAVLAAEDSNFYNEPLGIDFKGILRSILKDIETRSLTYGGSTLTQQLVRSTFLTNDKSAIRKVKEVILTLELERKYTKDQILEYYLNEVPFGSNSYGVEAAAQTFFNTPASNVTLNQAAVLASLIQAPSYLSPYGSHIDELYARRNYVLDRMAALGYISKAQAQQTESENPVFSQIKDPIKAPSFALYVKDYLEQNYPQSFLQTRGLKVYTTLNWQLQQAAEKDVEQGVAVNDGYNAHNASLVAIDPNNGYVVAMVGSANWYATSTYPANCTPGLNCEFEPKLNVAIYGQGRQPGSSFKPFAYAEAFNKGLTPSTIVWNVKTEFNPNCTSTATQSTSTNGLACYHPQNYEGTFTGPISLRDALGQSVNVAAVKVMYIAGLNDTINLAKSMGITTLNQPPSWYGLSLVLGGGEVKLMDMVSAYGVFATDGYRVDPTFITKIEDSDGNVIEQNNKTPKKVLSTQTASLINSVLSDNNARAPIFGYNSSLYIPGHQVAAKTGTTQNYKDAWTIGYTPSIVAGVWAGNNDGTLPDQEPGVVLAGPIWHKFMETALQLYPSGNFTPPETTTSTKPILNGVVNMKDPHSLLYYINPSDIEGPAPTNPAADPQYYNWEAGIKNYLNSKP